MGVYFAFDGDFGTIQLEYHDITLRIRNASWNITSALPVSLWIWDDDVLVHNNSYEGQGSTNVPGNYQLTWVYDPGLGMDVLTLPAGIEFMFSWSSAP